jgi:chaperone required for assembly of F1-ATPase
LANPAAVKRFYSSVTVAEAGPGWRVMLDARPIRTAAGRQQVAPTRALAEAMADEWADQGEEIDPAAFVLRDLANFAIDIADPERAATEAALLRFAETDTLCYRADPGDALHARQNAIWEPLLSAAEHRWDVHFTRVCGIVHQPQPPATLARLAKVLGAQDPFALAALRSLASLAASLVIALAGLEPGADARKLWGAANLEEEWQADLWGRDAEAEALRTRRFGAFEAAMRFAELARTS